MTGKIYLVGIGPGSREDITPRAIETLNKTGTLIGQRSCFELIEDLIVGKQIIADDLSPVARAELAVETARKGSDVAVVTIGDPGTFAIAGTLFSYVKRAGLTVDVTVVPGLPAANVASALLGAPIGYDFATISLSDQASSWNEIVRRIKAAAEAGFVLVLYNPIGKIGNERLKETIAIIGEAIKKSVPVGVVTDIGGEAQRVAITDLKNTLSCDIDVRSLIVIGNTTTFIYGGKMVTPRDYITGVGY